MPITKEDLATDVQAILGTYVEEGACPDEQPVCIADQRVTAQLTGEELEERVRPWRIENANEGYLLLCPGGPEGMIGGLLSQLEPPQLFSHMGIMVKDQGLLKVRHATAVSDRMKFYPHRAGTVTSVPTHYIASITPGLADIDEAPTDAFQEHAVRYGWPGTVTQSVEHAYKSWAQRPPGDCPDPNLAFKDGAVEKCNGDFYVGELSFGPVQLDIEGQRKSIWPVLVKPCDRLETDGVRQALRRIARAARELAGHYRFYAYTWAGVGLDIAKGGPQLAEDQILDSNCTGWSMRRFDPQQDKTMPMVCSSFIWLAVQRANEKGRQANPPLPRIVLDGRVLGWSPRHVAEIPCPSYIERSQILDSVDMQICQQFGISDPETGDGLYFYSQSERQTAGKWLYNYIHQEVLNELAASSDFQTALDDIFRTTGATWSVWNLLKVLSIFPVGTVSLMLGISGEVVEKLVQVFSDMPDDIASQICNAFADDDCRVEAKDSDHWANPGDGYTVSPDNIIRSWAAPTSETGEYIHGVYGSNVPAALSPPTYEPLGPPPSTWQISQGFGFVEGQVTYRGVGVEGAEIRIGCVRFWSGSNGNIYHPRLPAGLYWAECRYQDPNNDWLVLKGTHDALDPATGEMAPQYGKVVWIEANDGLFVPAENRYTLNFELREPPESRRRLWFEGHMDLVNRYAIGKDWWDHPGIDGRQMAPAFLGDFLPDRPEFAAERQNFLSVFRRVEYQVDDWGQAEFECTAFIKPGNAIEVVYRARLKSANDDPWQVEKSTLIQPKARNSDPGETIIVDLVRSEMAWPVRAHIELTIHNDRVLAG